MKLDKLKLRISAKLLDETELKNIKAGYYETSSCGKTTCYNDCNNGHPCLPVYPTAGNFAPCACFDGHDWH